MLAFNTNTPQYSLSYLVIVDSGSTIQVCNDLSRYRNFRKAIRGDYLIAGSSYVLILSYGDINLNVRILDDSPRILRLQNIVFCTKFYCNLVSFRLLRKNGYLVGYRT